MPAPYLAVLFDFDYTLGDASGGIVDCVNFALQGMGMPPAPEVDIRRTVGMSLPTCFATLTGDCTPARVPAFVRLFTERADQVMLGGTRLFPTVAAMLGALAGAGLRLGIVSTKFHRRLEQITQRDGVRPFFAILVGGDDVPAPKPDPTGLLQAAVALGAGPRQCLYVGDSTVDGETARRAGVDFAAVLTGATPASDLEAYRPVAILSAVSELPGLLLPRSGPMGCP
ncbi:MAG: HAD family hydrolase [Candidatus Latescibacterota bacterium]